MQIGPTRSFAQLIPYVRVKFVARGRHKWTEVPPAQLVCCSVSALLLRPWAHAVVGVRGLGSWNLCAKGICGSATGCSACKSLVNVLALQSI